MDVGAGPEPADDFPGIVESRDSPDQVPAIGLLPPIEEPHFHLEGCAGLDALCPKLAGGRSVVGVQEGPPALITHHLWQASELRPPAIQVIDIAVRSRGPDNLRHGVGELSEPLLALPQGDLGPLPLGDIPGEAAGVDELAVPPQDAGVDQYFLDGAVLASQAGRILVQTARPSCNRSRMSRITFSSAWKLAIW